MKPTAAAIDKESVSWTLSWQPEGRCDSFTKEAILSCAPPTSGVYGLFNFDCQIFIGESANIQDVLLRLESESDFQSQHLRPTGFTFEPCTAELRKLKAAELIERFRPVLQTEAALTESRAPSNGPMPAEPSRSAQELETDADDHEFPFHGEKRSRVHRRFPLKRRQIVAMATVLIASTVIIFYIVKPADNTQKRVDGAGENPAAGISITKSTASGQVGIGSRPQNAASIAAGGHAKPKAEPTPAKPADAGRFAANEATASDEPGVQTLSGAAKTITAADSSGNVNLSKRWSVQISAAPTKDIADNLVQQLIAKGYDGYMVQTEVKGQTYYRVRVGHFDTRQEAESMRQSLARQEGYRDAYLTGD